MVDLVVGPQAYHRLPDMLTEIERGKKSINLEFPHQDKFSFLPKQKKIQDKPSAYLTVQEGCDKFCSFCVVPFTRGSEASRVPIELIDEASYLVSKGVVELTLLGQNVNAYRHRINGIEWDLAKLIKEIAKLSNLKQLDLQHLIQMT